MSKEQFKQALISVVVGAATVFLVSVLEGVLGVVKSWMAEGVGGTVASARYLLKIFHG